MARSATRPDISALLQSLDAAASPVQRHLWLIALLEWVRGDASSSTDAVHRMEMLLDLADARPELAQRLQAWWQATLADVDGSTLLADYGFSSRNAFVSELVQRLHHKLLPASPETVDASELFALALHHRADAQWLAALPPATLARLAALLHAPARSHYQRAQAPLSYWQSTLLNAITYCTSQVRAAGFSPEIRLRMQTPAEDGSPFHTLTTHLDALIDAWLAGQPTQALAQAFRNQLDECRQAAASVYTHLDAHGISVDLVFRLRQLRERALRIRLLLDCLLAQDDHSTSARLLAQLAHIGQERKSVRALITASASLLAAKVAERSSETGEHYITRTRAEYRRMLGNALGGGGVTAITTAMKFGIMALGLSAFWSGFWAGLAYAASFVLIQLLHFTLATKQPAMTAPAMAAKLKDIGDSQALEGFVDEVAHLVRSQVAAVIGNVAAVFPAAIALSLLLQALRGTPMIDTERAHYVLHSLALWGPSLLYAAFTGVLLFASSILAGWTENWFVLHRLDSALRYNPRITRWLGVARADRWAHFMRRNVSGLAANVTLGLMLGLLPAILSFVGLGLDVRHVTLSAGQLAVACASLGWEVVRDGALWWAAACIPVIGLLNLTVSFYLAFRVAVQAHNVSGIDRGRIRHAVWQRLRQAPLRFLWPGPDARPEG